MNLRQALFSSLTVCLLIIPTRQLCHSEQFTINSDKKQTFKVQCTNVVHVIEPVAALGDIIAIEILESNIYYLKYGLFRNYPNVTWITMDGNNITNIAEDAFDNLDQLFMLSLRHNFIRMIPQGMLSTLHNLKGIDLRNNSIASVEPLLTNCRKLEYLDLGLNNISRIHLAEEYANLKVLHLSGNHISEFINTTNTRWIIDLDLSHNKLNSIDNISLKSMDHLESLSLSNNPLFHTHDVPAELFQNKTRLKYLMLSATGIRNLASGVFATLTNLIELDLSSNYLESLPEGIFNGPARLRELNISNNRLTVWDVENYPKFQMIDLNNNLWSCETLSDIVKKYRSIKAFVVRGTTCDRPNVLGIPCLYSGINPENVDVGLDSSASSKDRAERHKNKKLLELVFCAW